MDTHKKPDAMNRLSAGRGQSQRSLRAASQAEISVTAVTGPKGVRAERLTFTEDFMMEHSASDLPVALLGMGGSGGATKHPQPSTQFFGFPA